MIEVISSEDALTAAIRDALNAQRYAKLRRWMSSNVEDGWKEVERLAAVGCYMNWDEFDRYLDSLPECNVGLCHEPANLENNHE